MSSTIRSEMGMVIRSTGFDMVGAWVFSPSTASDYLSPRGLHVEYRYIVMEHIAQLACASPVYTVFAFG